MNLSEQDQAKLEEVRAVYLKATPLARRSFIERRSHDVESGTLKADSDLDKAIMSMIGMTDYLERIK